MVRRRSQAFMLVRGLRGALAGLSAVASFVVLISCSGSDSPGGDPPPGGGEPPPSGGGIKTSTEVERKALCDLAVPKCESYDTRGDCIVDHTSAASCFVTTVYECVKALPSCGTNDYDACMIEGAHACDSVSNPPYVLSCRDKNTNCKSQYDDPDDVERNINDSCLLLPALDDSGRAKGATCVAGSCAQLEKCLTELTP